jgi:hypothetical protein
MIIKLLLIMANIKYFILVGNTLRSFQLVKNGPNILWLYNQACMVGDPLAKQYAANTTNIL